MASIIKVDTIQDQDGNNIISEAANTITIGASGDTITIPSGATLANSGIVTGFQSTGIDDNATSTAITIDSSQRVGIGTASPSHELEIHSASPTIELSDSDDNYRSQITQSGSAFYFDADSGAGGSSSMRFRINGNTEAMRISSSGNVGIGTSSPDNLLHIEGDQPTYKLTSTNPLSTAVGTETISDIDFEAQNNNLYRTTARIRARQDGTWSAVTANFAPTALDFFTQDNSTSDAMTSPRMTINEDGNIGIGTTNPDFAGFGSSTSGIQITATGNNASSKLSGNTAGDFYRVTGSGQHWLYGKGAVPMTFSTDSSERMRIDSSGHLLVGSSSSAGGTNGSALQVKGDLGSTDYNIGLMNSINQLAGRFHLASSGSNSIAIGADPDDLASGSALTFEVDGSEAMRVTNGLNVGIGLTNPTRTFEVQRNVSSTYITSFQQLNSGGYILELDYPSNSPDNNSVAFLVARDSTTNRCIIWSDGDIQNHDGTYGTLSDERIKQNITDANSQWNDIKSLQFKNFKKKDDVIEKGEANAPTHLGVIAQELEQTSPGLVAEYACSETDASLHSDFTDWENATVKGVKYSILYMKAVKALQEAMERIETLETKVQTLENNQP
jgi:hypothetical protein